jgi:hypothetical protein
MSTKPKSRHYIEPDEKLTVVSYSDSREIEPTPLFAVETKEDGVEAAREMVEEHGGRAKWTVVNLKRVGSYDDVTELFDRAETGTESDAIDNEGAQ